MGDVVSLPGAGPLPNDPKPVAAVIETLRNVLKQAERGEIRAIGLAIVRPNNVTATAYACDPDEIVSHALTAATSYLHARYVAHKLNSQKPAVEHAED